MYVLCLLFLSALTAFGADAKEAKDTAERLDSAANVMKEIMATPDKGIPEDLLAKANCVVVVPSLKKGAFIVGAQYGKGFVTCRKESGRAGWSAPAAIKIEGGSVGFQIGGQESEVVLLVMNEKGAERLMSTKFTLGAEGSVAAGPVGRNAQAATDAGMRAEILSYSRARGVFAGVSLAGATLRPDEDVNEALYGKKLTTKEIVDSSMAAPAAAAKFLAEVTRHSVREKAADR
jgi:lipid-binding SYLF domain-containing protein